MANTPPMIYHVVHFKNGLRLAGHLVGWNYGNLPVIFFHRLFGDEIDVRPIYIPHTSILLVTEVGFEDAKIVAGEVDGDAFPVEFKNRDVGQRFKKSL